MLSAGGRHEHPPDRPQGATRLQPSVQLDAQEARLQHRHGERRHHGADHDPRDPERPASAIETATFRTSTMPDRRVRATGAAG